MRSAHKILVCNLSLTYGLNLSGSNKFQVTDSCEDYNEGGKLSWLAKRLLASQLGLHGICDFLSSLLKLLYDLKFLPLHPQLKQSHLIWHTYKPRCTILEHWATGKARSYCLDFILQLSRNPQFIVVCFWFSLLLPL